MDLMTNDIETTKETMTDTTIVTIERLSDEGDVVTVPAARIWDVYRQQWRIVAVDNISDDVLASLPAGERAMVAAAR